ncbi:MAG: hypothetical protein OHK0046_12500 [Anaerolineae bacterium]
MTADLVFFAALGLLVAHELDAVLHQEWRFFPFLKPFDDVTAYRIFVLAHVPLLILILANLDSRGFQVGMDAFLIIHAGLHVILRHHPDLDFNNAFSMSVILGAGMMGVLHLLLL